MTTAASSDTPDLSQLSPELLIPILTATNVADLPQIAATNSRLNEICTDLYFWQEKFKRDGLPLGLPKTLAQWINYYTEIKQFHDRATVIWQHLKNHQYSSSNNPSDRPGVWFYFWNLPHESILTSVGVPQTLVREAREKMQALSLVYNPQLGHLSRNPYVNLNYTTDNQWVLTIDFFDPQSALNERRIASGHINRLSGTWVITADDALTLLFELVKAKVSLYDCRNMEA
jgi:hypothetical protein